MSDRPPQPYITSVTFGFREDGVWFIEALIHYSEGLPPEGSDLIGEARLDLLTKIYRAALQGRSAGAERIHVRMDTGDRVSEICLGEAPCPSEIPH